MQPLLAAIMKFGLDIPIAGAYADPRKLADLAFEAGWDGFFIWDIIFTSGESNAPVLNPWVALAAIAMRTQRIRIGAMLTPLSRRRPWQVARETVSLDLLSNGRLTFGAGSGYQERDFTPFGEEYDPKIQAEKLDEGLEVFIEAFEDIESISFRYHPECCVRIYFIAFPTGETWLICVEFSE